MKPPAKPVIESAAEAAVPPPVIPDHTLLGPVGSGAYGEVWLARNSLGTLRAVKIVRRAAFDDDRPYEREFAGIRKFEPLSRTHEGFVDLLQVGRNDAEGWFYYVMELADSVGNPKFEIRSPKEIRNPNVETTVAEANLRASSFGLPSDFGLQPSDSYQPRTLASEVKARGALPLDECLRISRTLTCALVELHRHSRVHRDIKPSNIIFVGGVPKLADIGLVALAKGVGQDRSFVGTEGFIPPEGPGTPQADLYSLGIVLYVISTGKSHRDFPEPPGDLASRPDRERWLELQAVIHRACAINPCERYANSEAMLGEVERLLAGGSVRAARLQERRWAILKKIVLTIGASALLLTAGIYFLQSSPKLNSARVTASQNETFAA